MLLNVGIFVIHTLYIVLSITIIILLLLMLFQLVYALMFIQPLPFTNAPVVYAVLSLIPSAAISFVNWLLKTKVYQLDFAKHLKIAQTTEETDEQSDVNDLDTSSEKEHMHIPLLKVDENCDSESSFNRLALADLDANHDGMIHNCSVLD